MLSLPIGLYPKKGNRVVIGNYEDYQELLANKKYLVRLIETNNGLYISRGAIFFTCLKEFKGADTIKANILEQLQYHHTSLHS